MVLQIHIRSCALMTKLFHIYNCGPWVSICPSCVAETLELSFQVLDVYFVYSKGIKD